MMLHLAILAGLAAGQVPADDTITVTGRRLDKPAATAVAKAMLAVLPPSPRAGQYARWNMPVCPKVTGLDDRLSARIVAKFRAVATEAGAPVAAADCKTNIVISFTTDAAAVAARIHASRPATLNVLADGDRQAILKGNLPVRWWSGLRIEDSNGLPATTTSTALAFAQTNGQGGPMAMGGNDTVATDSYSSSLIDTHVQVSARAATVLVDVDLATGYRLDAVAAYISMAVLSQAALGGPADPAQTILGLFSGASPLTDLSRGDRALLAALYKIPANRNDRRQRGALTAAMVDALMGTRD
ncbi:hypothetical protein [Sandarakinorhabdus sp. DWP1-3-1]|uniref:hypothetical protein n=1 Tax=Sandarakinorhabdus sp. DWP1-3-1 TaxID=2804627 RepID=UPI003CF7839F